MSFEKQECCKCYRGCFCVLYYSNNKGFWYCDECYSWVIEDANHKDEVRKIMIQCGIEDIE